MSEEEIIKYLYHFISSKIKNKKLNLQDLCGFDLGYLNVETIQKAVEGLINLYRTEKEKNKKIEVKIKEIIDKIDVADYYCLNEAEEDLRKLINYYR